MSPLLSSQRTSTPHQAPSPVTSVSLGHPIVCQVRFKQVVASIDAPDCSGRSLPKPVLGRVAGQSHRLLKAQVVHSVPPHYSAQLNQSSPSDSSALLLLTETPARPSSPPSLHSRHQQARSGEPGGVHRAGAEPAEPGWQSFSPRLCSPAPWRPNVLMRRRDAMRQPHPIHKPAAKQPGNGFGSNRP